LREKHGKDNGRIGHSQGWDGRLAHDGCVEKDLVCRKIVHDGGKGAHHETIRLVVPAPARTAVAVGYQRIHDANLLANRIAAEDGGMLVDFKERQRRRRGRRSAVTNVQIVRVLGSRAVGEGA
jgi:hypothetical protein